MLGLRVAVPVHQVENRSDHGCTKGQKEEDPPILMISRDHDCSGAYFVLAPVEPSLEGQYATRSPTADVSHSVKDKRLGRAVEGIVDDRIERRRNQPLLVSMQPSERSD